MQGPRLLLPVMVTGLVSSEANAAFYVAYMIVTFLYIVPTHLSTVLFAVVAKDPAALRAKIRFTLRVSALLGAAGVVLHRRPAGARPILGVIGKGYEPAALSAAIAGDRIPADGRQAALHRGVPGVRPDRPRRDRS